MSLSSNVFRLTWTIEMFHRNIFTIERSLETGFFRIESLKNTRWNLKLFSEGIGKEKWLMCELKNGCGFHDSETVYLNFRLYLKTKDGKYFERVGSFIESGPGSFYRVPFILASSLNSRHYPNDTLVVECEIEPYQEEGQLRSADDLECLSKDVAMLYMNKLYSDLIVSTDDHQTFFSVHKFIICSRWNEANTFVNSSTNDMKLRGVSGSVFESFLRYLYSGKLDGSEVCLKLFEFASQHCEDLKYGMRTLSNVLSMSTPLYSQRKVLKWCISSFISSTGIYSLPFFKVEPLIDIYSPELMVTIDTIMDEITGEQYLDISFWFSQFKPDQPIFLRCHLPYITLLEEDSSEYELNAMEQAETHVFLKDEEWHFPPCVKTSDLVMLSRFQLVLTLDIGDCHSSSVVKTTCTEFHTESRSVCNLQKLSRDLKLSAKEDTGYKDVIIKTASGFFLLHRAMLSARSGLFREILMRSNVLKCIQTVNISPVDFTLALFYFEYIYGGSISYLSLDDAYKLSSLSDAFHMPKLAEFCRTFIDYNLDRFQM